MGPVKVKLYLLTGSEPLHSMHPRRDRAAELCDGSGHAFQSKQSRVNMLCLCARLERKPPHSLQAWTLWAGATRQFHRQSDGRVSRFECNSIPEPLCRSLGQGDGGREGGRERERFGLKPFWLKPFGLKFGSSWNCLDLEKGIGFSLPAIADLKSTGNPSS